MLLMGVPWVAIVQRLFGVYASLAGIQISLTMSKTGSVAGGHGCKMRKRERGGEVRSISMATMGI